MAIIDNSSNINKITNNSYSPVSTSSNTQNTANASPLPLVDLKKQELCEKFDITPEQYSILTAKYPNFNNLSIKQQVELVNAFKIEYAQQNAQQNQNSVEQTDVEQNKTAKEIFNEKTPDEKINNCFEALAKDIYINGVKDKNGNYIKVKNNDGEYIVNPHSEEEWNKLSDAEKKAEIQKLGSYIENNKELKSMKDNLLNVINEKDNVKEALADTIMRGMTVAKENGVSYLEYLKKDEYERLELENQYLTEQAAFNKNSLNKTDRAYMAYTKTLKDQVEKFVSKQTGEDVTGNLDISDVAKYMKYYNLNKDELFYNAAIEKDPKDRTEADKKIIQNYELPSYQNVLDIAKAKNLQTLKTEYNSYDEKLKKGETLTSNENGIYNVLKKYLSSDDAKQLEKVELPVATTDSEKQIVSDWKDFDTKSQNLSSDIKGVLALNHINSKLSNIPKKDRKEYVENLLKYCNLEPDAISIVYKGIANEQKTELAKSKNSYVRNQVALNIDCLGSEQKKIYFSGTKQGLTSSNEKDVAQANAELQTVNKIFSRLPKSQDNDQSIIAAGEVAIYSKDANTYNTAFDAGINMSNAKDQGKLVKMLQASENAPEQFFVDSVVKTPLLYSENQLPALDGFTEKSPKATAAAIEANILKDFDTKNQLGGMTLLKNRTEEQFGKEEAVKYSNMLSDQIKDCDKSNQLAMHNEMMNSKYSEVQEHVAGNIKDYDPTVQTDALETVLKSGNEKAIESAVENVKYAPDCVKSEMNKAVEAYVTEQAIQNDNTIVSSLVEISSSFAESIKSKIASGQLLSEDELSTLSMTEKREYFSNFFKKLPVDKKIKILASMPDSQKKTVYTLIARTNPTLFNEIVKDKDRSDQLLSMGLPEDVNNKIKGVVSFLAVSDVGFQNIASKYDIEYDNGSQEVKNKPYHTIPQEFDTKEIYKRDKFGNILT